jgi:hypothetical protein
MAIVTESLLSVKNQWCVWIITSETNEEYISIKYEISV